jgi:hypothetical protein
MRHYKEFQGGSLGAERAENERIMPIFELRRLDVSPESAKKGAERIIAVFP